MKREAHSEISLAIRELRSSLQMTQQDFAYKFPTAIRTIARWENDQPPRGDALVRLAQMAEAQGLPNLASKFVRALQLQMAHQNVGDQPELKGWLDGLQVAFRYRDRLAERWTKLAQQIIDAVDFATNAAYGVRSPEGSDFESLSQQLRAKMEQYKDVRNSSGNQKPPKTVID